jgi:GT2 family glycosyltransferase
MPVLRPRAHQAAARPRVSIVIPVRDAWAETRRCLRALAATIPPAESRRVEVVVVDDGSTDGTPGRLARLRTPFPLRCLPNRGRGFAAASNRGARAARGRTLVFLNNDTEPRPGWLEPLVGLLERDPRVGVAGARLLYPDGSLQHAGIFLSDLGFPYRPYRLADGGLPPARRRRDVPAVAGACLAVRRDLYLGLGGFDEGYPIGNLEDVEFCLRVGRTGRRVVCDGRSVVVHVEGATKRVHFYSSRENHVRFFRAVRRLRWTPHARLYREDGWRLLPVAAYLRRLARAIPRRAPVFVLGAEEHTERIAEALVAAFGRPGGPPGGRIVGVVRRPGGGVSPAVRARFPVVPFRRIAEARGARVLVSSYDFEEEAIGALRARTRLPPGRIFAFYRPTPGLPCLPNAWDEVYVPVLLSALRETYTA